MRKLLLASLLVCSCAHVKNEMQYDTVIRNATIYDGSGGAPVTGDVAVKGDRIAAVGAVVGRGLNEIDARGMAVSPGFINMLSWATVSLIADGPSRAE
jgi:N-acyl-D-amino-acid deacylase